MKLSFSELAVEDLSRLRKFVVDNHGDAQHVARQLIGSIRKLLFAPQIGRLISELPGEVREMVFGKYIIRYAIIENQVYILRIWHGKEHRIGSDTC
mgnify:CR=1 FL=1